MATRIHKINLEDKYVFVSYNDALESFKVVKPWKNEDGTLNWFNILTGGSWRNLIITAFIILVILGTLNEYSTNIQTLLDCFEVPGMLSESIEAFGPEPNQFIINP